MNQQDCQRGYDRFSEDTFQSFLAAGPEVRWRIRTAMECQHIGVAALAQKSGVSTEVLISYLKDRSEFGLSKESFEAVCAALNVHPHHMIFCNFPEINEPGDPVSAPDSLFVAGASTR